MSQGIICRQHFVKQINITTQNWINFHQTLIQIMKLLDVYVDAIK